ncbi:carbohydrate ABC transporter permease [Chloroflexota bacterium]
MLEEKQNSNGSPLVWIGANLGRIAISLFVPIFAFLVLYWGFMFLRDSDAPQSLITVVAIVWGVGGVALLYFVANWMVELLPLEWAGRLQPFVFVGPAVAILIWYLAVPTVRTFWMSLFNANSTEFAGLTNYAAVFTERIMVEAWRNNILWLVFGTSLTVISGLLIAMLSDRSSFERVAKSLIFMPMAISMVGAGVIFKFIYDINPDIGLLNATVTGLGGQPRAWLTLFQPWNNFFLIIVMIWLQTGFAMVLLSAAIKGVPDDLLEAARVDGGIGDLRHERHSLVSGQTNNNRAKAL